MRSVGKHDGTPVDRWRGKFWYLTPEYPQPVTYEGVKYRSIRHAYLAAALPVREDREAVAACGPVRIAERMAAAMYMRADQTFPLRRERVMEDLYRLRFTDNRLLRDHLVGLGEAPLVYDPEAPDPFWGLPENRLGLLLEKLRAEYRIGVGDNATS